MRAACRFCWWSRTSRSRSISPRAPMCSKTASARSRALRPRSGRIRTCVVHILDFEEHVMAPPDSADLRGMLDAGAVVAPGVYDALTASLAAAAGFRALYVSGAAIAYTRLGGPDIGLVSMTEVAETIT